MSRCFYEIGVLKNWLLIVACLVPAVVFAQEKGKDAHSETLPVLIDLKQGVMFEISPHTGAMGGSGLFGLKLSMNYSAINLEVSAEQVIGESADLYPLSVNLLMNLATQGRLFPYGAIGGGLFLTVPTNAVGSRTVSSMALNYGGGARFYLTKKIGIRVETRQYITNVTNRDGKRNELLIFQSFNIGATFMFH